MNSQTYKKRIEIVESLTPTFNIVCGTTPGKRSQNEDHFVAVPGGPVSSSSGSVDGFFCAIYDGHNGSRCSKYLAKELHESWHTRRPVDDEGIKKLFFDVDKKWNELAEQQEFKDGSTGICSTISNGDIVVANVGDSRALLCQAGKPVLLSNDHKPTCPKEAERIEKNGGAVIGGRLQGKLDVSRSFGDIDFKKENYLTCEPELTRYRVSEETDFLILASDGLFEEFGSEEAVEWVRDNLKKSSLREVVDELLNEAIERGSGDNISVVIIKFDPCFYKQIRKKESPAKSKSKSSSTSKKASLLKPKGLALRTSGKNKISANSEPKKCSLKTSGKHLMVVQKSKSATTSPSSSPTVTPSTTPTGTPISTPPISPSASPSSTPNPSRTGLQCALDQTVFFKLNGVSEPMTETKKSKSKNSPKKKDKDKKSHEKDSSVPDKIQRSPLHSKTASVKSTGRAILTKSG